ncbi:MAG: fibrobacter succinogenes major paralogous domain-containing protein, partial [Dysgonamonadaceae bacterium]|nr:fibrobacter succinogenes major paralogous domain-containing protein [Dysgonamonadaceae bacterium]
MKNKELFKNYPVKDLMLAEELKPLFRSASRRCTILALMLLLAISGIAQSSSAIKTSASGVTINGITWAPCNVSSPGSFSRRPEDAGKFYQWNGNKGWALTGNVTGWDNGIPSGTEWEKENDPCPPGWRVPTQSELEDLLNSSSVWTTRNGVYGGIFGSGSNTVFLPAVGYRFTSSGTLYDQGSSGYYWS